MAVRGKIRNEVLGKSFSALLRSVLFWTVILSISSIISAIIFGKFLILIFPVIWISIVVKRLVFEVFLLDNFIEYNMGIRDWFNKVDDDLYLGGIPLNSMDHKSVLCLDLKIEGVLSILEDFEFSCSTLAGTPIQPDDWKREDVQHIQLKSPDFYPPSFEVMEKGAEWINSLLSNGKRVYCHCKSGIGRSASVVIAYYMIYKKMSAEAAYNDLKSNRKAIFKKTSSQYKNILLFEKYRQSK